jgi:LPS-assembly lipoprotein
MSSYDRRLLLIRAGLGVLALGLGTSVQGCGFRPVYGGGGRGEGGGGAGQRGDPRGTAALRRVRVAAIEDRVGQQLHNALMARLRPSGGARQEALYRLDIDLSETVRSLGIGPNDEATRTRYTVQADYTLRALTDDRPVLQSRSRVDTDFNVTPAPYANTIAREAAQSRSVERLADLIVRRLSVALRESDTATSS